MIPQVATILAAAELATRLILQLEGADSDLRTRAVDSLTTVGRSRTELLDEGLRTAGWRGREGIFDALSRVGEAALPVLMTAARAHPKPDARRLAVRAVGQVGGPAACDSLVGLLQGGERDLAAQGLGESGDPALVPALVDLLQDERPAVRRRALVAIGRLAGADEAARVAEMVMDPDHGVRFAAAGSLIEMGPAAVEALAQRVNSMSVASKVITAHTLGRLKDVRAVPCLESLLHSADWAVRSAAVAGLIYLGDTASAQMAKQAASEERNPLARSLMKASIEGPHVH
jgi:HEAT repeat protein